MIRVLPPRIIGNTSYVLYATRDGFESPNLDEAIDHENEMNSKEPRKFVPYEQVWTIQEAINKAVAESRVVRFLWPKDNASIRKGIVDIKDCKLMKPDKNSHDIAVIPPCVPTFDFDEVK